MYQCDFCNVLMETTAEGWPYQTKPTVTHMTATIAVQDDGLWLACDQCAAKIEQGDKKGLEERSIKTYAEVYPQDEAGKTIETFIHTLHSHFWEGRRDRVECKAS